MARYSENQLENDLIDKLVSIGYKRSNIEDLEGLKDPNKKSDFIYDVNNIDKVMLL